MNWMAPEVALLERSWHKRSAAQIAHLIGRTPGAVKRKYTRLTGSHLNRSTVPQHRSSAAVCNPSTGNPLLRSLAAKLEEHRVLLRDVEKRSGVSRRSIYDWLMRLREPRLSNFVAVVEAMGGEVVIVWPTDQGEAA